MKEIISILFENFETLDVFGPIEVLGRLKDNFFPRFYSLKGGIVYSSQGVPIVTKPIAMAPKKDYILLIPGGGGTRALFNDKDFINSLFDLSLRADYILNVCTGSVLFSKTGLLDGKRSTTNKRAFKLTEQSPKVIWEKRARWVKDCNIYSSSGVSAGIDMTLGFISDILGYKIAKQQANEIEYIWSYESGNDPFCNIYD